MPRRANEGNEATLNGKLYRYISNKWVEISTAQDPPSLPNITDSYVKRKYEGNDNTNALTDDLLAKLTELPTAPELVQQISDAIMAAPDEVGLTNAEVQSLITAATANFLTRSEILELIGFAQSVPTWRDIPVQNVGYNGGINLDLSDYVTGTK